MQEHFSAGASQRGVPENAEKTLVRISARRAGERVRHCPQVQIAGVAEPGGPKQENASDRSLLPRSQPRFKPLFQA